MLEEYDGSSTTLHFFGTKPVLRDVAYLFEVTRTMNRVQLKFLSSPLDQIYLHNLLAKRNAIHLTTMSVRTTYATVINQILRHY
jgi:hypothetical protein